MISNEINIEFPKVSKKVKRAINQLNISYVKSNEKVAYYYEDLTHGHVISFNANVTFYAASVIKIIVVLYLYKNAIDLDQKIEIYAEDIKQGTGILKNENFPKKYTLFSLMKYSIMESDNTAYLKLVDWIGKEKIIMFGKSLGAQYTFEGKDNFGIVNCNDLKIYWKELNPILEKHPEIEEWFVHPSYEIITSKSIQNKKYLKKYGFFGIAYHEAGIVKDNVSYLLIILTQKGENKNAKSFINKTAKRITAIHTYLNIV